MEKQELDFEIEYPFDWSYGVDIQKMKKDLEELERLGVNRIDIGVETFYDSASVSIKAICHRLETDEECAARIEKNNRWKEEVKARELAQLEKLKKKYGQ